MEGEMLVRVVMLAAALLAAASVQASAEASGNSRTIIGQGTKPCGEMTREIRAGVSQELSHQWVAAFAPGANMEATGPDFLIGMEWDGLMEWVANYCKANPLARVSTAAKMLVIELRSRARRR
jgi:hypothetical protein